MTHKKLLNSIVAAALLTLAGAIASYLVRFAMVFLGVFSIYKVLWERVNGRMVSSEA
jgi:hypothetical protein